MNMNIEILQSIIQQAINNSEMSDHPRIESKKPEFITNHMEKKMGEFNGFHVERENTEFFIILNFSNYEKPVKKDLLEVMKAGVFFSAFWGTEFSKIPINMKYAEDDGSLKSLYEYFKRNLK